VTVLLASVPLQSAVQPSNRVLAPGVAVSVTMVSKSKLAAQVPVEQAIRAETLVTVPLPAPVIVNVSCRGLMNVAVQVARSRRPPVIRVPEIGTHGLNGGLALTEPAVPAGHV
jgi:hypothetical protein